MRPAPAVLLLLVLAGCSSDASPPPNAFLLKCDGVVTSLNGYASALSDVTALPVQTFRIDPVRKAVARVLSGGKLDSLCIEGGTCVADFGPDRIRVTSRDKRSSSDFLLDRRTGWAYQVLKITLGPDEAEINHWQMICSPDRAKNAAPKP